MAYVSEESLEQEESQTGAPLIPGGGAGGGPANAAGAAAASAGGKKKTPGRFADLGEYLRVNEGQQFGQKLAGKIGEDVDKGASTLASAQDEFKTRADSATVRDDQNLVSQVGTRPEDIDVDSYARLRDASYTGPKSLVDAQDLSGQVQGAAVGAVNKANATKTEGGRFALLDNYFGKPQYGQGQKSLDNLLVQNDKGSQQAFDQMRQNAKALEQNVGQAGVDLGNYGAQAAGTTQATRASARGALGIDDAGNYVEGQGALGQQFGELDSSVAARRKQAADEYAAQQAALAGKRGTNELDPELAQKYGLTGYGGNTIQKPLFLNNPNSYSAIQQQLNLSKADQFYGEDASNYLNRVADEDLNRGTVATQDQAARLRTLQKLSGMDTDLVGNLDQAGTYDDEDLLSFNKQGFDAQRGAKASSFSGEAQRKAQELSQKYATPDGTDPNQQELSAAAAQGEWKRFMEDLQKRYSVHYPS